MEGGVEACGGQTPSELNINFGAPNASTELCKEWECHGSPSRVITHNRCDPEECVTAFDMAVDESVPRYIKGLYLTHRPEVERGWDPQSMTGW